MAGGTRGPNAKLQKTSYVAATAAKTATEASTKVFGQIFGSATKTVRIQRITLYATVATAAVYGDIIVTKRTAVGSGGTATTLAMTPKDSNSQAATATVPKIFTVGPTAGTGGGIVGTGMAFMPVTGTPAAGVPPLMFDFTDEPEQEAVVLRGIGEGIELSFATTPTNAPTVAFQIEFTEEPN
jgi:hypothetical protein